MELWVEQTNTTTQMLSARVEAETVAQLTALADLRGITRSALIRRLVEDAVADEWEVRAA